MTLPEITGVFAGDLKEAHREGVRHVRKHSMVGVSDLYDLVITGNSGYPLDLNMYQAVKGMSAAYQIVKDKGHIIVAADCWDGVPSHGYYGTMLRESSTPEELLDKIRRASVPVQDRWQAQIHAEICSQVNVHFYSENLSDKDIVEAFMVPVSNIEDTVQGIIDKRKEKNGQFNICVLPQGPLTIPYHEAG